MSRDCIMQWEEDSLLQKEGRKLKDSESHKRYREWLDSNGVLVDRRLEYPAVFKKGLVGVSTRDKIEAKAGIIAVPYTLIIHTDKIAKTQPYQSMVQSINGKDKQMQLLCMFLIVERLKGEKGFYHPYLEVASQKETTKWGRKEIAQLEHPTLMEEMSNHSEEVEEEFVKMLRVIRTNPEVFPEKTSNQEYKELFEWAYKFVETRAFSMTPTSISLIPFADALNHGQRSVDYETIDLDWWRTPGQNSHKRNTRNLSLFNQPDLKPTLEEIRLQKHEQVSDKAKYIQKHQHILEGNQDQLSEDKAVQRIAYLQYNTNHHTIRQLQLFEDSEDEDDQDSDTEETKLRRYLVKEKEIVKGSKVDYKILSREYWGLYEESTRKRKKKESSDSEESMELSKGSIRSEQSSEESSSSDSDLEWLQNSNEKNIYFVIHTIRPHLKGEQVYSSYGNRSNNFLLLHYNFAILDNPYDYYPCRLKIDLKKKKPEEVVIGSLNNKEKGVVITKEIKIRRNVVCVELINHCRYLVSQGTGKTIVLPFDKDIQTKSLQMAKSFVKALLDRYQSTPDQDLQILQNKSLSPTLYFAVTTRLTHKHILCCQLKLLDKAGEFLCRWKSNRISPLKQGQLPQVRSLRKYLQNLQRSAM